MASVKNKISRHAITGLASKPLLALLAVIIVAYLYLHFSSATHSVENVARAELNAIQRGDLQAAYHLTSTTFQQQTKPEAFAAFIGQYPILQQDGSVTFSQQQIEKTVAALGGILTGGNGRQMQIQFQFVKENEAWRIQGLSITPLNSAVPALQADNSGATIKTIMISNQADKEGYVTKGVTKIDKLSSKIYVTVQIMAPKAGGQVEASMTQLSNGQQFGPSIDAVASAGNILKAFAFTKVTNAWDAGNYQVTIKLSSGDTKTQKFVIK